MSLHPGPCSPVDPLFAAEQPRVGACRSIVSPVHLSILSRFAAEQPRAATDRSVAGPVRLCARSLLAAGACLPHSLGIDVVLSHEAAQLLDALRRVDARRGDGAHCETGAAAAAAAEGAPGGERSEARRGGGARRREARCGAGGARERRQRRAQRKRTQCEPAEHALEGRARWWRGRKGGGERRRRECRRLVCARLTP